MTKFLLRYILAVAAAVAFFYFFFIFMSINQKNQTIERIDTQILASFKTAARTCQSSVLDEASRNSSSLSPAADNPNYYKYYYNISCDEDGGNAHYSYSGDYKENYLYILKTSGLFDEYYNILSSDTNRDLIGLIPADFALPYVQLAPTSLSKLYKESVKVPTVDCSGTVLMSFDSDLASQVRKYLMMTIPNKSSSAFLSIKPDENGAADVKVTLLEDYDETDEALHYVNNSSGSAVVAGLGPVYQKNNNTNNIAATHETAVLYYSLGINVEYTLNINIPLLPSEVFEQTISKDFIINYSMLN